MLLLDRLAEETIEAAMRRGEFDALEGAGQPLVLEDDGLVPEELRVAYRLLRNAGCLPPEQQLRNEISDIEDLLGRVDSDADEDRLRRRLWLLRTRLAVGGREISLLLDEAAYRDRLLQRLAQDPDRQT
jgi:hypothetical protein